MTLYRRHLEEAEKSQFEAIGQLLERLCKGSDLLAAVDGSAAKLDGCGADRETMPFLRQERPVPLVPSLSFLHER